ncbi:MAG: hypothetical protein ACFCVC_11190 [Acidimicrobiia bacterium]
MLTALADVVEGIVAAVDDSAVEGAPVCSGGRADPVHAVISETMATEATPMRILMFASL